MHADKRKLEERQLQRELTSMERCRSAKREILAHSIEKGNLDQLPYKNAVMKRMLKVIDDVITDTVDPNHRTSDNRVASRKLIQTLEKEMDLSVVIADFLINDICSNPMTLSVVSARMAKRIDRAYRMAVYQNNNKFYYEEMKRFLSDSRLRGFDQMYKRFVAGANYDNDVEPINKQFLSDFSRYLIGKILDHDETFLASIIDFVDNKRFKYIFLTADMYEKMAEIIDNSVSNSFERIPCVAPPRKWVRHGPGKFSGGFLSQYLAEFTPIQLGQDAFKRPTNDYPQVYLDALNKLQSMDYSINKRMYHFIKKVFIEDLEIGKLPRCHALDLTEIPPDVDEQTRKELSATRRKEHVENVKIRSKHAALHVALEQSKELMDDLIYFVHAFDYRGRLNCVSNGLNLQTSDYIKSLLQFGKPREVGEEGLEWLKVRLATFYCDHTYEDGTTVKLDSKHFWEMIEFTNQWIEDGTITKIAEDPIGTADLWKSADKPMQFLATVFDLAVAFKLKDPTKHMSALPICFDGSCNGSQHLAVLSGDKDLAYKVNVLPSDQKQDLYQEVADYLWKNMLSQSTLKMLYKKRHDKADIRLAIDWMLETFSEAPRKLVKRGVMTLPYGSTVRGRMDFVREFMEPILKKLPEKHKFRVKKNKMVVIIAQMLEEALTNTTSGAIKAMQFLQAVCAHETKKNGTFKYTTPLGLTVDNYYPIIDERTSRFLNYKITVKNIKKKPSIASMKNSSAPNFIHSLDACHLIKVVNRPELTHVWCIHDDLGTYPSDATKLYNILREEFVDLYKDKDYFDELSDDIKFIRADYIDIDSVLDSPFLFA